ncbi:hypothetical protein [Bradyrhizobium icense]|uniref:DinB/UmuC family translesion DNA polymerase n=1 Tax=Bradyrhizobium icense TaxID=1274631 RepID=UPI0009F1ACA2
MKHRSRSVAIIDTASDLSSLALDLLKHLMPAKKAIRLLGIPVSGFNGPEAGRRGLVVSHVS